jgi:leucyl aminopeptidase
VTLPFFAADRGGATPIAAVGKAALPAWLERHPQHRGWLASAGFTAEPGTFAFLPGEGGALASIVAAPVEGAPVYAFANLPGALPEGRYALAHDGHASPDEAALGWALGAYSFDRYRKPRRAPATLAWPEGADRAAVERLARSVFLARDLVNTPAEDMGPQDLAEAAKAIAVRHGASLNVIGGDDLLRENYPTIHVVGRASRRPPCLIDLQWGEASAPKVTLVGKGVCFDTGGLDLKTHAAMLQMKKDMGGGAVVLALADALMAAATRIRLRVLVPAVENSVSGNAMRPRDIVRTRSGRTVEIGNTDAEGRLILCDALTEADREAPDLLVDCATLTGAARVALGPEVQALFCNDDALADGLVAAGNASGDPLWRLPLWRPYRRLIDSRVADFNNVADSPFAGAIVAALYLAEFVSERTRWAHLDMMAANTASKPGRPEGGEATGLRALYAFIRARYA